MCDMTGSEINGKYRLEQAMGLGQWGHLYRIGRLGPSPLYDVFDTASAAPDLSGMWMELVRPGQLTAIGSVAETRKRLQQFRAMTHPNLLPCHDEGIVQGGLLGGCLFIVTPPRDRNLGTMLAARQTFTDEQRQRLVKEILHGLSALHDQGLAHGLAQCSIVQRDGSWQLGPALQCSTAEPPHPDLLALGALFKELFNPVPEELRWAILEATATDAYLTLKRAERPLPVTDLAIEARDGTGFRLGWTQPPQGSVQLVKLRGKAPVAGSVWLTVNLDLAGERVADPQRVAVPADSDAVIVPVTVLDEAAAIGNAITLSSVPDVTELSVCPEDQGLKVTWSWPDGIENAFIIRRDDQLPEGPLDPCGRRLEVSRHGNYLNGICLERVPHLAVYAAVPVGRGLWRFSGGLFRNVPDQIVCTVRYRAHSRWGNHFIVIVPDHDVEMPSMVLVEKERNVPVHSGDGKLLRVLEPGYCVGGETKRVDYDRTSKSSRVGLFLRNPLDSSRIRLVQEH
jgi:hypothetical protein